MIIIIPTRISAGAVAALGMEAKSGFRKSASRNRIPVVTAVRPVLPPTATPEALSTKVVTVEVPSIAPAVVPTASDSRACLQLGMVPSSRTRPELLAQPISVPMVSNISTNRKVNRTTRKSKTDFPLAKTSSKAKGKK